MAIQALFALPGKPLCCLSWKTEQQAILGGGPGVSSTAHPRGWKKGLCFCAGISPRPCVTFQRASNLARICAKIVRLTPAARRA